MKYPYVNEAKAIVADTYLAYNSEIDGAEAFDRFLARSFPLVDVKKDPKFAAFSDEELIDEMSLLEKDIVRIVLAYADEKRL